MKKKLKELQKQIDLASTKNRFVEEGTSLFDVVTLCEESGWFHYDKEIQESWNIVKSKKDGKECIRIIFRILEGEGGKVQNIDRVMELIKMLETHFVYLDDTKMIKKKKHIYVDVVKVLN